MVPLGEVISQDREYVTVLEPREYRKLSVRLYGKGVVLDSPTDGSQVKMQRHQFAKPGQVVLSEIWGKKGAIGFVPPEGEGALCTSHFFLFDLRREKIDPGWLDAIFRANYLAEQLGATAFGTTGYAAVRPKDLLAATIPLPPLSEQRRIVARVEELAAKIEEALGCRKSSIDGIRGVFRAVLRSITNLSSSDGRLGDFLVGKPRNGWSPHCDNSEDGAAVLSLGAVTGFRYNGVEHKRTSLSSSKDAHYWLRPGDLLITRSNTPELVGHAAVYDGTPSPCIYPDLMMRIPVNSSKATTEFVWYWLQTPLVRDFVARTATGTSPTMKKISQGTVMAIPFPASITKEEQRRIVAYLDNLQAKVDCMKALQAKTQAELDALLPSILDKAFKGEL